MGAAHSYPKRSKYHTIGGGRLVGRGAGSWLPCPADKEVASLGLCQYPCRDGYEGDGFLTCAKPVYWKPTRVLPPHVGVCPPDKEDGAPWLSAGLCYTNQEHIPAGHFRRTAGLLDQYCPQDKAEWTQYENFKGILDIGVSCQRATYTRPPHPLFNVYMKPRKKIPGEPPPIPFCDEVQPKHGEQTCIVNRKKADKDSKGRDVWVMSDNRDVYYKQCDKENGWGFDSDVQKCFKDDDNGKQFPPMDTELEKIEYSVIANPLCSEVDKTKEPNRMCILNDPPDDTYAMTEDGESYYQCPAGYEYDEELRKCIKWAPMAKKTITKSILGTFPISKVVDDYETYHKQKLDTVVPKYIPVQYGTPSGAAGARPRSENTSDPILQCKDTLPSKKLQLCINNSPPPGYGPVNDDFLNFYKKCNEGYKYEDKKCNGPTPYVPETAPIDLVLLTNPLCSVATSTDKFCREEDAPEGYEITSDGEQYFMSCEKDFVFNDNTRKCVNKTTKEEKDTILIKVKYGTPHA